MGELMAGVMGPGTGVGTAAGTKVGMRGGTDEVLERGGRVEWSCLYSAIISYIVWSHTHGLTSLLYP